MLFPRAICKQNQKNTRPKSPLSWSKNFEKSPLQELLMDHTYGVGLRTGSVGARVLVLIRLCTLIFLHEEGYVQ